VASHTVVRGDTLFSIAQQYGLTVADLYNANRVIIGGDPNLIRPGMVLSVEGVQVPAGQLAPASTSHALPFHAPLDLMHVTQAFKGDAHRGIDLHAPLGTPGYAAADCDVVESEGASGFGLWTVCRTTIDGVIFDLVYGHMNRLLASVGQHFKSGEQIINTGNNGDKGPGSVDPHLHFEVWVGGRYHGHPIDPVGWLNARGVL
jgi:murein DD-endopeptidase MepM/ murein hydrolase activator NlpD